MMRLKRFIPFVLIAILFTGCPSTHETAKVTPPPPSAPAKPTAPAITIQLGALDLSRYGKKIEQADVEKLATAVKHAKLDILTVQGITRYPDLPNRVDIVGRLSAASGMRNVFGETSNFSGQQHGNAVFSEYPIRTSENTPYEGLRTIALGAALQAVIDCGARDIVVVSTLIPGGSSPEDEASCVTKLGTFGNLYTGDPVIITGNLPQSSFYRAISPYDDVQGIAPSNAPHVWFSGSGTLKVLGVRTVNTVFGPLVITSFGIFGRSSP